MWLCGVQAWPSVSTPSQGKPSQQCCPRPLRGIRWLQPPSTSLVLLTDSISFSRDLCFPWPFHELAHRAPFFSLLWFPRNHPLQNLLPSHRFAGTFSPSEPLLFPSFYGFTETRLHRDPLCEHSFPVLFTSSSQRTTLCDLPLFPSVFPSRRNPPFCEISAPSPIFTATYVPWALVLSQLRGGLFQHHSPFSSLSFMASQRLSLYELSSPFLFITLASQRSTPCEPSSPSIRLPFSLLWEFYNVHLTSFLAEPPSCENSIMKPALTATYVPWSLLPVTASLTS